MPRTSPPSAGENGFTSSRRPTIGRTASTPCSNASLQEIDIFLHDADIDTHPPGMFATHLRSGRRIRAPAEPLSRMPGAAAGALRPGPRAADPDGRRAAATAAFDVAI